MFMDERLSRTSPRGGEADCDTGHGRDAAVSGPTARGGLPVPYTLLRRETRLSTQDIETICAAARQR